VDKIAWKFFIRASNFSSKDMLPVMLTRTAKRVRKECVYGCILDVLRDGLKKHVFEQTRTKD